MRWRTRVAMLAAPMLLTALPAHAEKRDFSDCDGLEAPGRSDGGMKSAQASSGWAMPAATGADSARLMVSACDRALADPRLPPDAALRRAHLLRARALAKLQGGDAGGALADLDTAQTAAGALAQDPLFARSMGVSLTLARAAAWQVRGDRVKARTLAADAAAARPYSTSIQLMAALIAQRARDPDTPGPAAPFATMLPLNPTALELQFGADIEAGRFEQAAALFPRLKQAFPDPGLSPIGLMMVNDNARTLVKSVIDAADTGYAYAAIGDAARSQAVLSDAAIRLTAALVPKPDGKGVVPPVGPLASPLRMRLELGTVMANSRVAIAAGKPIDALRPLVGVALPVSAASLDLLTALRAALPAGQRELAPDPAAFAAKLAEQRRSEALDVAVLRKAMPAPETTGRLADYAGAGSPFVASLFGAGASNDGFRSKTDAATGITRVEFVGQSSSAPAVEELTLLRAADLARQAGKPGLLIVGRNDYARTLTTYRGYDRVPVGSRPAGYKTDLDVRFVDPAALPPDLVGERDRVLDANQVYAALAPIYIPAAALAPKR